MQMRSNVSRFLMALAGGSLWVLLVNPFEGEAMFDPRGENQGNLDEDAMDRMDAFFNVNTDTLSTLENGPDPSEVAQAEADLEGPFGPRPKKAKACWKDGESRGKGQWPDRSTRQCPENKEKSMGMCYPHCGTNRNGVGPLCLDDCSKTIYRSNGMFFCCDTEEVCKELVQNLAMKLPKSVIRFLIDIASNPNDARRIMRDFREIAATAMQLRLPLCSNVKEPQEVMVTEDFGTLGDADLERKQPSEGQDAYAALA